MNQRPQAVLMINGSLGDEPIPAYPDAKKVVHTLPVCPITGRPLWKGMVIPWTTRWTGERCNWPIALLWAASGLHMAYGDPRKSPYGFMHAFTSQRDELGLLWLRELHEREGWGKPLFSQIQAARARRCMMERMCQVCGRPFADDEATTFLIATDTKRRREDWTGEPFSVESPPVCLTCIPISMRQCPEQSRVPRSIIHARAYQPWRALVDVMGVSGVEEVSVLIDLDDDRRNHSVCKQLSVLITDYDEEYL